MNPARKSRSSSESASSRPAGLSNSPRIPWISRPRKDRGKVQRKVPVVWRGSGLVKTSSVGMLERSRRRRRSSHRPHTTCRRGPSRLELGAGRAKHEPVERQSVEPVGARRQHLDVVVPGVVRVVVRDAAERREVEGDLARRRGRVELGVDGCAPPFERERDDAEAQRVPLHRSQVDGLSGNARRTFARGAVGIGAVHQRRVGRPVDRDRRAVRSDDVAHPLLRPPRLVVEGLRPRVVDPRAAHGGLDEGDVDVVRAGGVRDPRQGQDQRPVRGLAVDREKIAGPDGEARPDDGVGIASRVRSSSNDAQSTLAGCTATTTRPRSSRRRSSTTRRSACGWTRSRSTARARTPSSTQRRRADDHPGRHRRRSRRCSSSTTCSRPACISVDHPRYLSFIPARADRGRRCCSTSSSARRRSTAARGWRAPARSTPRTRRCAGSPTSPACRPTAGGVFVPGGTVGNLSALVAARHAAAARPGRRATTGRGVAGRAPARRTRRSQHGVRGDGRRRRRRRRPTPSGRLTGAALREVAARAPPADDRASPSSPPPGTTNFGIVDDLAGDRRRLPRARHLVARRRRLRRRRRWPRPRCASCFAGIERADSFIVDPHKWLFAPFDCCALLYRDPALARAAHTQHAGYLDVLDRRRRDWNPTDYAVDLTRRARGLPFWFSLATHGTRRLRRRRSSARSTVARVGRGRDPRRATYVELLREPDLSVVVFRRLGWTPAQYHDWSDRLLAGQLRVRHADRRTTARRSPGSRSSTRARRRRTSPPSSTRWPEKAVSSAA